MENRKNDKENDRKLERSENSRRCWLSSILDAAQRKYLQKLGENACSKEIPVLETKRNSFKK